MVSSTRSSHTPPARLVEDRTNGKVGTKLSEGECTTYPVDDYEFFGSKIGMDIQPAAKAYTPGDGHALRLRMNAARGNLKVVGDVPEVGLRDAVGDEIVGDAENVGVTGDNAVPFLRIDPETSIGRRIGKCRIVGDRRAMSGRLFLEVVGESGEVVTYAKLQPQRIEVRDGEINMLLKKV